MRFALVVLAAFLAVDPTGWDHFGPLRFALISTIGFFAIGASLGAGDSRAKPLPRWAPLGWTILLFGLLISTLLSVDRIHAVIGTPDRHLGLVTWLLFAGLFATVSLTPQTLTRPIERAAWLAAAMCGCWAILENADVGWFSSEFANDREGGPFGQPAFLGAGMAMLAPFASAALFDPERPRGIRLVSAASGVLALVALGLSGSRAAWVGVVIALVATIFRRRAWKLGAVAAIAIGVLLAFTAIGERAQTLTELDTGVVAGRLDEWQVGSRALFDSSTLGVFGYGPEGYRVVFGEHVDEQYVLDHGRDVITDRAHSGPLDVALTGGIVGAIGYLLLAIGVGSTALARLRADDPVDVGLAAATLAYLIQQLFLFPLIELDPAFWILAALLIGRRPVSDAAVPLFRQLSGMRRAATVGAFGLGAIAAIAGVSDIAADHAVASLDNATDALAQADTARSRRPDSIRYDFIAARVAQRAGTLAGFEEALDRLDDGLSISPRDPALLAERGQVLLEIARRTNERDDIELAESALADLEQTDPRNPDSLGAYGIILALTDQPDRALEMFDRAAALSPDSADPLINAAVVALERGDLRRGAELLDDAEAIAPGNARIESLRREFLRR